MSHVTGNLVIESLRQRWPDTPLLQSYRLLLSSLSELLHCQTSTGPGQRESFDHAFESLCLSLDRGIKADLPMGWNQWCRAPLPAIQPFLKGLPEGVDDLEGLQRIASILGMFMHFSISTEQPGSLMNGRRPHQTFTTYPTSPAVARTMADYLLDHLVTEPVPQSCRSPAAGERYARRCLTFRLLDPSMESGQLLLQVAISLVQRVHRQHTQDSLAAHYLNQALLERLCHHCLYGIDRNPRAIMAVEAAFSQLGAGLGLSRLIPRNLLVADSLRFFEAEKSQQFEAVLNNPPWGEPVRPDGPGRRPGIPGKENGLDSYVAFSELALRVLKPGGVYGLILPSQALAAAKSRVLRESLVSRTSLDYAILLPRAAFASACVRGLVLLGRLQPAPSGSGLVEFIKYPPVKNFADRSPVQSVFLPAPLLRRLGGRPWTEVINAAEPHALTPPTVRLGDLATIVSGVKLYQQGRGSPPQTAEVVKARPFTFAVSLADTLAAVRGRDILEFRLKEPTTFIKYGPWLAGVGQHLGLRHLERVFLRELYRRDGKLTAAVASTGFLPLQGVFTIVPRRIDARVLAAILNSRATAAYVRQNSGSFTKVDFQRITVAELCRLPVPVTALDAGERLTLGLGAPSGRETTRRHELAGLAAALAKPDASKAGVPAEMRQRLEDLVSQLYS